MHRISVIDSHTAGEPTRVVLGGAPALRGATLAEQRADFSRHHDGFRSAVACEPRGSDTMVGALLVEPRAPGCVAGMIFFNNVGMLGMCGHGTIGVVATLAHLGRIAPGRHRLDTPVGPVETELHADGRVTVFNVPAYRHRAGVTLDVPGIGPVTGDVAWGGNWFFLVDAQQFDPLPVLALAHVEALTDLTWRIRGALAAQGIAGADGAEIDHVELFAPSPTADARNFVLCPGKAYDRSPCGTGTSAKLACLAADGHLAAGATWVQESVIGSRFEGRWAPADGEPGRILPAVSGRAWITAESTLLLAEDDPFRDGIRA
ncbi:proline racemase family protein [Scleromatobacter humisilvae]|uniref:Proline racemase family protein n=1 Tax=Scleromatobacter humisilvae TaxID=2897159 RepID=A0A9X1YH66_9BURK|nr:proline racemase family protein [Scleromatobacter humisilvae]MCK9686018.1 proline racemase family protein [Scleromatobacter humisilvae]